MKVEFTTHWPDKMGDIAGQETHFVEKIWQSFPDDFTHEYFTEWIDHDIYPFSDNAIEMCPKSHTIRPGNRWKAGDKIHFQVWTGKPYRSKVFQFAPVIEVKSVQDIKIKHTKYDGKTIFINNEVWWSNWEVIDRNDMQRLAQNDGFDSVEHFFRWFDSDFAGQIIHWTDLKY